MKSRTSANGTRRSGRLRVGTGERFTHSAQFLSPVVALLRERRGSRSTADPFATWSDRVVVEVAHRALGAAVASTNDPDLGLEAARRLVLGDLGIFDYVLSSSPTVGDAIARAGRYGRLVSDALAVRLEGDGSRVTMRFDGPVVMPRSVVDLAAAGLFRVHVRGWLGDPECEPEVLFTHRAPRDVRAYRETFGSVPTRFGSPVVGFSFHRSALDRPLPKADENLHRIVVTLAEESLRGLPDGRSVTQIVRSFVEGELPDGTPTIEDAAEAVGMTARTLARKLRREGTSFREINDVVRRQFVLESLGGSELSIPQIARRAGFSSSSALSRAFQRWTGGTAIAYRRASRG